MITQHEFVAECYRYYRENYIQPGNPEDGKWERAHYPTPTCKGGEDTILLLWEHHQLHGILQSIEFNHRCFYPYHVKNWLNFSPVIPDGFFDLWDAVETYHGTDASQFRTPEAMRKSREGLNEFFASEKGEERKREVSKFMSKEKRKPLEIHFIDGRVGRYPCQRFAAAALGVDYRRFNNWMTGFRKIAPEFGIASISYL
jgi:hypothetical protein